MKRYLQPGDRVVAQAYLLYLGVRDGSPAFEYAGMERDDDLVAFDWDAELWMAVQTDSDGRLYVET